MPIFELPTSLREVVHFTVHCVRTWGNKEKDDEYRKQVCRASGMSSENAERFEWFVFCIRCVVSKNRNKPSQVPDVDNIAKQIVEAFNRFLYQDDNMNYVRGVQVEAEWGPDDEEKAQVWIYGQPKEE